MKWLPPPPLARSFLPQVQQWCLQVCPSCADWDVAMAKACFTSLPIALGQAAARWILAACVCVHDHFDLTWACSRCSFEYMTTLI